ncbi:hypothetical protein PAPYR_4142 [Paratrimastix pyriformis]|uniref:Uncharacterized protein n=1 Tax=Paratrimastix pyriformis TaxID=342808 RepID=A0ABQ8UKK9_9EUKA|nr:hypothetical protein PAPYR_4142 [Paratrimastix pyriformis]
MGGSPSRPQMVASLNHRDYRESISGIVSEFEFAFFPQRAVIRAWPTTDEKALNNKIIMPANVTALKLHQGILYCGLENGTIKCAQWDFRSSSGRLLDDSTDLTGQRGAVKAMWIRGDSLFCGCEEMVRIWDLERKQCYQTLQLPGVRRMKTICTFMNNLYIGSSNEIRAYDLQANSLLWTTTVHEFTSMVVCQGTLYVGCRNSPEILCYSLDTGLRCRTLRGHHGGVTALLAINRRPSGPGADMDSAGTELISGSADRRWARWTFKVFVQRPGRDKRRQTHLQVEIVTRDRGRVLCVHKEAVGE